MSGRTKEELARKKAQEQNAKAKKKKTAQKKKAEGKSLGLSLPMVERKLPTLSKQDQKSALERVTANRKNEKKSERKENSVQRYNPLIKAPTRMTADTSPEIDNLAEATVRKMAQGFEGALVGYSDRRNMKRAEDYLSGEYNNRVNPFTRTGMRMKVDDPAQVAKAKAEAERMGYKDLDRYEKAKANELIHANDDFYQRKAFLDKRVELENYQGIKKYIPEVAEQIGSLIPTMAVGAVSGGIGSAAGLSGAALWAFNTLMTGGEIAGRVSGQEAKQVYDYLKAQNGNAMNREQMLDAIRKANTTGELVGIAEAGTEALFGGLPFIGKGILDTAAKKVGWEVLSPATKESIKAWRNTTSGRILTAVAERTGGALGEGVEEAVMTLAQPAIESKVAGMESEVTLNDIIRDFGMGAAVSLVLGVPVTIAETTSALANAKSEKDAKNEILAAFTERNNELVAEGKMTPEQAKATVQEVQNVLNGKGSLRVSDVNRESKTESDTKEVYATVQDAKAALKRQAKEKQVGEEVSVAVVENGVPETWTAKVTENGIGEMQLGTTTAEDQQAYTDKAQRMAKAKTPTERSGIQHNVKEEIVQEVSELSNVLGKEVEFFSAKANVHGYVENGRIYVNANSSQSPAAAVIAHEMTHLLEGTKGYNEVVRMIWDNYGSSLQAKKDEIRDNYAAAGKDLNETDLEYELVAMFVEEKLLTDSDTIRQLATKDRSVVQKIVDWINNLIQKITGTKEQRVLLDARKKWMAALGENKKAPESGVKYSAGYRGIKVSKSEYKIIFSEVEKELAEIWKYNGAVPRYIVVHSYKANYVCEMIDPDSNDFIIVQKYGLGNVHEKTEFKKEYEGYADDRTKRDGERVFEDRLSKRQSDKSVSGRLGNKETATTDGGLYESTEEINIRGRDRRSTSDYEIKRRNSIGKMQDESSASFNFAEKANDAEQYFGTTVDFREAGYLTTNGKLLDFSGVKFGARKGQRSMDHREIADIYENEDLGGGEAMVAFMNDGNIRMAPEIPGIDISVKPNEQQEKILRRYFERYNGYITLDISNEYGDNELSFDYPKGTRASKIIIDIRNYFDNGVEPFVSEVSKFRFSIGRSDDTAWFDNDIIEYNVGTVVELGFGERGIISDKFRMNNDEFAYTVNLNNGEVMNYVTAEDIVYPKAKDLHRTDYMSDMDYQEAEKKQKKIRDQVRNQQKNYFVGDTVSYLGERATIQERSLPMGGSLIYTLRLETGELIEVTPDQLEVGVTPDFRFNELPKEDRDAWKTPPEDWDGAYDNLDELEEPPVKNKDDENPLEMDEVRHMLSDYSDMLEDPTEEEIEFEWAWTKKLTGNGVSFLKDYVRNIEAAANGNKVLEQKLRELFVAPFRKGKNKYVSGVHSMLDELYDKMQELGIQKDSPEAAAVMKYGEKKEHTWKQWVDPETKKKVWITTTKPYSLEKLKSEFPDTWENIVEADRWFREKYDSYLVQINEVRREIYGHHFKHREMEITTAKEKAKYHKESRASLANQLAEIEHCLRAKRMQLAIKRQKQSAKVSELEKEIDYNAQYYNTISNLMEEHKEKEEHYNALAADLERDLLHGESWNQKRLKARKDYYHHMREESSFLEDLFVHGRNSEIDPTLEGKSVGTKPKAKWSGIFERQGRDPFKYDAVSSFIDYIQAAEYAIHMDPVISQFRSDILNIATATQLSKNCNKLILWLTNWTNDLSGKTTDHVDRWVQERIGRDHMRKIRKIVSRSKFNAVGLNLNSAIAQFGNLPNALAYVQNPQSWGKGLQLYLKWLYKDDDARRIVKNSTFLDERFLDTVMSKFDQRLKDKPEKFAAYLLRFGDMHSSFMIWCVAYEDALRKGLSNPVETADEITMESVAGRGVGEIPLQMRATWTQIVAPFQIEVNNAYQIYKKKMKTLVGKKSTRDQRVDAGTSFLLLLLGNFVLNTISDLVAHRRILFDPIYVLLETIGEWIDEEDEPEEEQRSWWERFRDLTGREIGNLFSNMPYGDLMAYYVFNNEWAREKLFGDYDPTRFGVGNIVMDWAAGFATDLVTGDDLADDVLGFLTTFVMPFGGKQTERILKGLVQAGWLPDIDFSTGELPSIKRQKAPGVYNRKDQLQFPVPTLADNPLQALMAIVFGAYTTEYGEKYLGKDRKDSKWWENVLGWNKTKPLTALSDRATQVYDTLVANGADQFAVYDAIRNIQKVKTSVEKRNVLLEGISSGAITEENAVNILLGYITKKDDVPGVEEKLAAFEQLGLSVSDYLEMTNAKSIIDNDESYENAQDKAWALNNVMIAAGYTADQIKGVSSVMKFYSHIPADTSKFDKLVNLGLDAETTMKVTEALGALKPLPGEKSIKTWQKAEAIAGLGLTAEQELAAMSAAMDKKQYAKYESMAEFGVTAQTWVDFEKALAEADAANSDESKRNGSYDKDEKAAALASMDVSNAVKAVLWQSKDNSTTRKDKDTAWKAARNPYDSGTAAKMIDSYLEKLEALETADSYASPLGIDIASNITSEFGMRVHPVSGVYKEHTGVDIKANQGEPVLAAGAGEVVKVASSNTGYGNHVVIEHEDGTQTLYGHLYSYGVKEGDIVTLGQQIGEVGSTGTSTGNHLHFEVRKDGVAVDPQSVFDLTGEGIKTDGEYTPIVSGGGSSSGGGGSSGGGSSKRSYTSTGGTRVASVTTSKDGSTASTGTSGGGSNGGGLSLPMASSRPAVTGRSVDSPTYGTMGLTLPRANANRPTPTISTSVATTQRTGRTGGSLWDPDVLRS